MKYRILYTYKGKEFVFTSNETEVVNENRYEVVANGLLLTGIEQNGLPRNYYYSNVTLLEITDITQPVWSCKSFCPNSIEVK